VQETANYPFGHPRNDFTADPNNPFRADYKFTGKEKDKETGLQYFEARYLANHLGRFAIVDPLYSNIKPDWLTKPQSLNLYVYGLNNPVRFTDPTGLDDEEVLQEIEVELEQLEKKSRECQKERLEYIIQKVTDIYKRRWEEVSTRPEVVLGRYPEYEMAAKQGRGKQVFKIRPGIWNPLERLKGRQFMFEQLNVPFLEIMAKKGAKFLLATPPTRDIDLYGEREKSLDPIKTGKTNLEANVAASIKVEAEISKRHEALTKRGKAYYMQELESIAQIGGYVLERPIFEGKGWIMFGDWQLSPKH
jgi:RHS repeat-associated protein